MPTELDLQQCFHVRAETAHDGAATLRRLESGTRPPASRRRTVPFAVAAAVITVLALVAVLEGPFGRSSHDGGVQAGRTPLDPALFHYGMTLDPPPAGYKIENRYVSIDSSRVVYDAALPSDAADIAEAVVYREGAFDAATVRTGASVDVNGVTGFHGPALGHVDQGTGPDGDAVAPSIAWQYAPDSWAVVTGTSARYQTRAAELSIARTVRPGGGAAVRLPFRVGRAPSGISPSAISTVDARPLREATVDYGAHSTVSVSAGYGENIDVEAALSGGRRLTIAGRPAAMITLSLSGYRGHRLVVVWDHIQVEVTGVESVPTDELVAVANGLTMAPSGDPATWFTAADAL